MIREFLRLALAIIVGAELFFALRVVVWVFER